MEDVRDAATYILAATSRKSAEDFSGDRTLRQAVERNFEIIGEALSRIGRADPTIASRLSDSKRIIAFRNILIHGYDSIDVEIVWQVIQHNLPTLLAEIQVLLREAE